MRAQLKPEDCTIKIHVLVDENYISDGGTSGVWSIDNQGSQSSGEGGAKLDTAVSKNDTICWTLEPVNPASTSTFQIESIGNSEAWGFTGQPEPANTDKTVYVGIAEGSSAYYEMDITVTNGLTGQETSLKLDSLYISIG